MKIDINDEDQMQDFYVRFAPGGSGPLTLMSIIQSMVKQICEEKGFALLTREELEEKNR